jgi:hypothetical protein
MDVAGDGSRKGLGVKVNRASGVVAVAAGVGLAIAADETIAHLRPTLRTPMAACGLIAAAAIYPLSRRRLGLDGREAVALVGACSIAASAASMPSTRGRRLLGAGWVSHALYDAAFTHDANTTRLPKWYAPLCAGADSAMGVRLALHPARQN